MTNNDSMEPDFTLEDILNAYRNGMFPMAENRDARNFHWYDPTFRGQLSIKNLTIPKRLQRTVLQFPYEIRINSDFGNTIKNCAAAATNRPETWINDGIRDLFIALHKAGHAHSIEAWDKESDQMVGGLYGLAIGGAFFGESMFSRARDASKIALIHLCARLWHGGFTLLDTQFINEHLLQFGAYEIPRNEYMKQLENAAPLKTSFLYPETGRTEKELVKIYLDKRHI